MASGNIQRRVGFSLPRVHDAQPSNLSGKLENLITVRGKSGDSRRSRAPEMVSGRSGASPLVCDEESCGIEP